ncbi:sulfatase-like hydrolase/transferase [Moraxella bovis]|uniref:sulfatase-like hydrolase/transferase n=1 Tax=Moraxella bovis TaxID=476 RepID=UPI00117C39B8|nr:sulfatase-like hydrolase/transferase [Moraxella bovis]
MTIKKNSSKKYPDWLVHDYKLPKLDWLLLAQALIFLLIPNVFLLIGAYFVGVSRPLINIDYFVACVLFALPYQFFRVLAMLVLLCTISLDVMMMTMQLFPFLDIFAAISLAPFLVNAPLRYIVLVGIVATYLTVMPFIMRRLAKPFMIKTGWLYVLFVSLVGFFAYSHFNEIKYVDRHGERFAQSDYFVIHSQYKRYRWVVDSEFIKHFGKVPTMIPIDIDNASGYFGNSDKKLLIVAESWGVARHDSTQKDILAGIYNQTDRLKFIKDGYFDFAGATVEGELRELCLLDVEGGYAFNKVANKEFDNCLPNQLKRMGYHTIGMHGGFSQIYERDFLYPKMGFAETVFAEHHGDKKRCEAFNGICDNELFDIVAESFATHDKNFFYWLTLTSHSHYPRGDIINHRLDCNKHNLPKGDICNNFMLHAQFFDGLGELIKRPEMAGVEVIVVGDHMPPLMMREPIHPHIHWQRVSWLHFKVKA